MGVALLSTSLDCPPLFLLQGEIAREAGLLDNVEIFSGSIERRVVVSGIFIH